VKHNLYAECYARTGLLISCGAPALKINRCIRIHDSMHFLRILCFGKSCSTKNFCGNDWNGLCSSSSVLCSLLYIGRAKKYPLTIACW